jgi:hypothetical protein
MKIGQIKIPIVMWARVAVGAKEHGFVERMAAVLSVRPEQEVPLKRSAMASMMIATE